MKHMEEKEMENKNKEMPKKKVGPKVMAMMEAKKKVKK